MPPITKNFCLAKFKAKEFDYALVGDGELEISALKYAHDADEHSLAIAYTDKDVINTAAQAVLTEPRLLPVAKSFLYSGFNELNAAIIKIAKFFIAEGIYPDYEKIFPQTLKNGSMFGENVAVGKETIIAPFVSVGENVTIGKNCRVEAGVFIGSGTVIGDVNETMTEFINWIREINKQKIGGRNLNININQIEELDDNMQQEARAFDDLRKMKVEQDSRIAAKQVECMYYENLCDIMFDELKTSSLNVGR